MVRNNGLIIHKNHFELDSITGFINKGDIENIRSYVLQNDGATILRQNRNLNQYIVGIDGFKVNHIEALNFKFDAFIDTIHKLAGLLDADGFGIWIDENKDVYFDVIKTFKNEHEAIQVAKQNNEFAIYDIVNDFELQL